jgi:hypothetical protein
MAHQYDLVLRGSPRQPNRSWDKEVARLQRPRDVTHSHIFWLNMTIPFTSVASELSTALTAPQGFDTVVRAGWTDLQAARVLMTATEADRYWSAASVQIPVRAIMGNSNEVSPLKRFPQPLLLEARASIRGDWLNSGAEAAGTACYYAEKAGVDAESGQPYDGQVRVTRSMGFWLLLDLSGTSPSTQPVNNDILIWGATTNIETSAITGQVFNDSSNYAWSSVQIPIRAMAGVDGQVQPVMHYHNPYFLPANVKMRAQTNTAVTGGYVAFLCERILG